MTLDKEPLTRDKGRCERCRKEGTVWLLPSINTWLCNTCLYQVTGREWKTEE